MKIFFAIVAAVILFASEMPVQAADPILITGIEAVVHDSIVTYQEVEMYTAPIVAELRRRYQSQPEVYQQKLAEALNENLQQMMNQQIILHEYERAGYKIPDSIVDQAVEERIRTRFSDRAAFTKALQAQGMTKEQFRKQIKNQIIIGAMQHNFVSEASIISPHKIQEYYAAHQADYQVDDQVKVRMIVINKPLSEDDGQTKRMADEVLSKLKDGAPFDEMASVYSQGSQAAQGGDMGWMEKKIMRKDLAEVAFSLKAGERTGVLEASDGYYIMLVEQNQPAHIRPLKEVHLEIEKNITADDRARLEKQWVEKLREKTYVRLF